MGKVLSNISLVKSVLVSTQCILGRRQERQTYSCNGILSTFSLNLCCLTIYVLLIRYFECILTMSYLWTKCCRVRKLYCDRSVRNGAACKLSEHIQVNQIIIANVYTWWIWEKSRIFSVTVVTYDNACNYIVNTLSTSNSSSAVWIYTQVQISGQATGHYFTIWHKQSRL